MDRPNTFGDDYTFPSWVPERTQEMIRDFWGQFDRTYKDWLHDATVQSTDEVSYHGPGPNGFRMPPFGATVEYILEDRRLSKEVNEPVVKLVKGRYVHRWNNMGSLIDEYGDDHTVSTGDRWVRWFESEEEKANALANIKGGN